VLLQLSILSFSHKIHVPRNVNTPWKWEHSTICDLQHVCMLGFTKINITSQSIKEKEQTFIWDSYLNAAQLALISYLFSSPVSSADIPALRIRYGIQIGCHCFSTTHRVLKLWRATWFNVPIYQHNLLVF
jgi:hypothetical protein